MKCVLIGCGAIAREHLTALAEIKNVEVAAVCDISAAKAEATAERFSIKKWYTNHEQALSEIRPDLVHITTPPSSHVPIARSSLTAGFNVLCEKPITVDYQQFIELKELALRNGCMLLENHNIRFHSSIRRLTALIASGDFGEVLEVHIFLDLNLFGAGSPYLDANVPHFSSVLRGGVVGDFLTHIACLTHLFIGSVSELRTVWVNKGNKSPVQAEGFRGIVNGDRGTAFVSFNGTVQPSGFWVRIVGTKMQAEANLYEPPRLAIRRFRPGEPAFTSLLDGIAEARDVARGTIVAFWRKLAGTNRYDGLSEFLRQVYRAIEMREAQPIPLNEIDEVARLVDRLGSPELKL